MSTLAGLVEQFSARYHKALIARAALLAGLGSGCCALLAWRLMALHIAPSRSIGIPAGLLIALFAALGAWLNRRWMAIGGTAAFLDRTLGLKQRLITAQEFAASPEQSPLYPALVEDLSAQVETRSLQTPRPWNHATGLLAVALLLLLLWPQLNPMLPPGLRQPEVPPQTPQPKDQQAAPPQEKSKPDQAPSNARQQSASGPQQQGQSQSSGANQQQGQQASSSGDEQAGGSQQPSANGAQTKSQQAGEKPSQANPQGGLGGADTSGAPPQDQPPSSDGSSTQGDQSAAGGKDQPSSAAKQQQSAAQQEGSANQQTSQPQQGEQKKQAAAGGKQAQSAPQQQAGAKPSAQSGAGKKLESPHASDGSGSQGLGQSMGDGQQLKADIQKLLKEMSGELKELQGQLDAGKNQPRPQAGSGTDPNLYGSSEPLDPVSAKNPVPLQLEADRKAADNSGRPAGGVGKASGDVSASLPQMQAQQAQLSDNPLDENASPRQPIPVEYRSVFDQLRKQPAGGQKP